jgi:hypothetical protein
LLRCRRREGFIRLNIVKDLIKKLGGIIHIVMTNNFFMWSLLLMDLFEKGTMAIRILGTNQMQVTKAKLAKKSLKNKT